MIRGAAGIGGLGRPEERAMMKPWLLAWTGLWTMAGWAWHAVAGEVPMPPIEPRIIPPTLSWTSIFTSVVYGLIGLILLLIGYYIYELITPFSVKEELVSHRNPAVGLVVAAFILGMAIVIAAAII
jgi:putative membrane protein